jgi:predicted RNA polymerase sigma factor
VNPGDALARLVREEGTRVPATMVRVTGDLDLAQDAVQDAVLRAVQTWPGGGVPDEPRAWLLVAAKRRAIEIVRRESRRPVLEAAAVVEPAEEPTDLLRLIFTVVAREPRGATGPAGPDRGGPGGVPPRSGAGDNDPQRDHLGRRLAALG